MAFTTTPGASGSDFVGTAGVDSLFALNVEGTVSVEGLAGNDIINASNSTGTIGDVTVKGGEGNDTISFDGAGGTNESVISDGSVNGGAGNDTIVLTGSTTTKARGNEGNDNFTLSGNLNSSTINGNSGVDSYFIGLTAANASTLTLQSTKIHGGADNDGVMRFNAASTRAGAAGTEVDIISAVDSTINGSKGIDNIAIGNVTTASGFEVRGGQGNDSINVANGGADGILYAGDKGDDNISITGGNADASIEGGEGSDNINTTNSTGDHTISGGEGVDNVVLAVGANGGDDLVTLGDGNDIFTAGTGDDTITGGAGADTYAVTANRNGTDEDSYVISSIADSPAIITGTVFSGDTISANLASFTAANAGSAPTATDFATFNTVDITAVADQLLGDTVTNATTVNLNGLANPVVPTTATTFAELRTALGNMAASGNDVIQATVVSVTGGTATSNIDGTYLVFNNTSAGLDSGDLMFEIEVPTGQFTGAGGGAAADLANTLRAEALLAQSVATYNAGVTTTSGVDII